MLCRPQVFGNATNTILPSRQITDALLVTSGRHALSDALSAMQARRAGCSPRCAFSQSSLALCPLSLFCPGLLCSSPRAALLGGGGAMRGSVT